MWNITRKKDETKKKVSIFINDLDTGGAERVVSILLFMLKERYDITLFMIHKTIFYEIPKDIRVVIIEGSNPKKSAIFKLLKLPLLALKYKKMNRETDISISYLSRSNYINILAKLFGMKGKVIINERSMLSLQYPLDMRGIINRILIRILFNRADLVVANSKGNCKDLKENFGIKNITVINNLFDIEKVVILSKEKVNLKRGFNFITVGRLDEGKNHKLIIEAMKYVQDHLYIIGDGVLKDELNRKIEKEKLDDRVFMVGKQTNPYRYLSKSDCFVFASNHEGFPNVLVEALICQLPIISTDCRSGPREILAPSTDADLELKNDIEVAQYGILIPTNDLDAMIKSMNLIKNEKNIRENYKNRGMERARDFSKDKIVDKMVFGCLTG